MKKNSEMFGRAAARRLHAPLVWTLATALTFAAPVAALADEASSNAPSPHGSSQQSEPPAKPDGSGPSSDSAAPPPMPGGDGGSHGAGGPGGPGGMPPGGPGGGPNTRSYDYSGTLAGALTVDGTEESLDGETIAATDADQNAVLVHNGGNLTLSGSALEKSGDDTNGDNCNFYGLNSIVLSVGEDSTAAISETTMSATSEGSNGIFATDSGTVFASNDAIATSAGNARGLDATYGGTIVADQMSIATQGDHCAAFATDRGGGNISVANSDVSTAGSGSPLIYSTGDIEIDNVTGVASGSQIAGVEGLNTIMISNSTLESTITGRTASDPIANGVIIYQSTSGDADTSTGEAALFQAVDSTLASAIASGSMFYLTNTAATVVLQGTVLDFDSGAANLLTVAGNDANHWGTAGKNGAAVTFTGIEETLSGNVSADTISSVNMYLLSGTTWTGAASIVWNDDGNAVENNLVVNVDAASTWVVTADSTLNVLNVEGGGAVVDANGKRVTIVADGETVVEGDSNVTVTVTDSYATTITTSEANEVREANIDRSVFDDRYGTTTTFGTNSGGTGSTLQIAASSTTHTSTSSAALSATTSAAATTSSSQTTTSTDYMLPIGIGAIVVVAAGVGAFVYRRKGDKTESGN